MGNPHRLLEIFVLPFCFGCETAIDMADRVRSRQINGVDVQLIDLSDPTVVRPESVVAVPTYRIDGRVVSLGNPEEPWLLEQLAKAPV